jgi:hypothetical protein
VRKLSKLLTPVVLASGLAIATTWPSLPSMLRTHDMLLLTPSQKTTAWRDLHRRGIHQYASPGFYPMDRWVLPDSVQIRPVPRRAARDVRALRSYDFAIVQGSLLIVNPSDKKIVEVIRG